MGGGGIWLGWAGMMAAKAADRVYVEGVREWECGGPFGVYVHRTARSTSKALHSLVGDVGSTCI